MRYLAPRIDFVPSRLMGYVIFSTWLRHRLPIPRLIQPAPKQAWRIGPTRIPLITITVGEHAGISQDISRLQAISPDSSYGTRPVKANVFIAISGRTAEGVICRVRSGQKLGSTRINIRIPVDLPDGLHQIPCLVFRIQGRRFRRHSQLPAEQPMMRECSSTPWSIWCGDSRNGLESACYLRWRVTGMNGRAKMRAITSPRVGISGPMKLFLSREERRYART